MQYPAEIQGVSNIDVIQSAIEKKENTKLSPLAVYSDALAISAKIRIEEEMLERDINVGFSGGEKKKNELLHMFMIKPKFAFLDEVDSGLDVDSILAISNMLKKNADDEKALILISHYKSIYEIIKPDYVIIISDGKVNKIGDYKLLMDTLDRGFDES
jgi:Fe-S cluster assembly ATP-binding protein